MAHFAGHKRVDRTRMLKQRTAGTCTDSDLYQWTHGVGNRDFELSKTKIFF